MDCRKPHLLRLMDVRQRIIDEETFVCGSADAIERDLKDLRVRLHVTNLAGNDHIIQQVEEIVSLARVGKGLGGPVAQSIEWVASLFQFFHDLHGSGERFPK